MKTNNSGTTGVCWNKQANNWKAYIHDKNKRINLGHYKNKEDAISARKKAEIKYNYTIK